MPFPNEHAVRIADPGLFDKDSFRRKEVSPGISIIMAKKSGSDAMEVQAYRFKSSQFTFAQVKAWMKSHKIKHVMMEEASGPKDFSAEVAAEMNGTDIDFDPEMINIIGFDLNDSEPYFDFSVNATLVEFKTSLMESAADVIFMVDGMDTTDLDDSVYIEKDAVLFEKCERDGREYDEEDLDSMVKNFTPPKDDMDWTIPIQLDHSKSAMSTVGNLRKVWHDGKQVLGTLRFIGKQAVQKVTSGLWKKLSIGLSFLSNGLSKIREVTVTPFPYLERAGTFSQEFMKGDESMNKGKTEVAKEAAVVEMSTAVLEPKTEETPKVEDAKEETPKTEEPKVEETTDETPKAEEPKVEEPVVEETKSAEPEKKEEDKKEGEFSDTKTQVNMIQELENVRAEFSALKAEFSAKLAEKDRIIRFAEIEKTVVNFMDEGKTTPAMKDKEIELIQTFSDTQMKAYVEMKNAQPKIVVFDTLGTADGKKPAVDHKKEAEALLTLVGQAPKK